MSQETYNRFAHELTPGGTGIMEEDLVRISLSRDKKVFAIPATRFAEELGNRMVVNSVMVGILKLGYQTSECGCGSQGGSGSVPSSFREMNLKAFEKGFEYGLNAAAGAPPELEEVGYAQE